MPQPLENPLDPRVLPSPIQRRRWLAHFLPGHPWRSSPAARQALTQLTLNDRHPWLSNPSVRQGGLSERQIDVLLAEFACREGMTPELGKARGATWGRWLDRVLTMDVEIQPAGRAIVIDPRHGFEIALRFAPTGKRQGREPFVALSVVEVRSRAHPANLPPEAVDLTVIYAAFAIELERIGGNKSARKRGFYKIADRPEAGRPPKIDYYFTLLSEADALKARGHPAPDRELAERYGVNRSTLRGHLRKARELRAREQGAGR